MMNQTPVVRGGRALAALLFLALPAILAAAATPESGGKAAAQEVATFSGPMPTGVTVSREGRVFINFPRWGDDVTFTVAELKGGKAQAYPNEEMNTTPPLERQDEGFVGVQSVVVDPADRLWALDTGSIMMSPTRPGGPKLVGFDLKTDKMTTRILVPPDVALPTTYLNDVRFDLRRGTQGMAFITDSTIGKGPGGLIVVDLGTGRSWRRLSGHPSVQPDPGFVPVVEGKKLMKQPRPDAKPEPFALCSDGIAISADGKRLYYCPLTSRKLYSVSVDALADPSRSDADVAATVREEKPREGAADGLESDAEGNLYLTDYENHRVVRRSAGGEDSVLAVFPEITWPDTMSVTRDGQLYVMANQLQRQAQFHQGKDLRQKPYILYRIPVKARPVELGREKERTGEKSHE